MSHGLQPLALACRWTFRGPVEPKVCAQALGELLADIASACQAPSDHVIGHIKAYASLPAGGFIRGNATSARQAPDVEVQAPADAQVTDLDVTLNVLVVGQEPAACRRQVLGVLDAAAARHGFEHSILTLPSQGEH
ncbi:MAG: hypothetical protein IT480_12190 [Gammaproteobacteria bacterium]|nr:hypothetical protein [Gammaproteobacteria bacterium]